MMAAVSSIRVELLMAELIVTVSSCRIASRFCHLFLDVMDGVVRSLSMWKMPIPAKAAHGILGRRTEASVNVLACCGVHFRFVFFGEVGCRESCLAHEMRLRLVWQFSPRLACHIVSAPSSYFLFRCSWS